MDSLQTAVPTEHRQDHQSTLRRNSADAESPGVLEVFVFHCCAFPLCFFLLSPSLWLCCYFLVVVGDGDSRWLLGTLAHWCACQTARRRTTVSQPPPPLITISAYPQLQAVLRLVGGLVLYGWNEWWAWVSPHCFEFVSSRSRDRAESSCGQSIHQFALLSISHVMPTW